MIKRPILVILTVLLFVGSALQGRARGETWGTATSLSSQDSSACPLAHTHIGKNPTWRPDWSDPGNSAGATDPDPTDDNKLWLFSIPPVHAVAPTPGWPNWGEENSTPFLLLSPATNPNGDPIYKPGDSSQILYESSFMYSAVDGYDDPNGVLHIDGWHSAHGPQGAWNLETVDQATEPSWDIRLVRESVSLAQDDFFMALPNGTTVLTADGDEYALQKRWLDDFSAWGMHEHMSFNFWLAADGSDLGSEVVATFSAYDAGGMYTPSDAFDFRFRVVPEPVTLSMLMLGGVGLVIHRRTRMSHV